MNIDTRLLPSCPTYFSKIDDDNLTNSKLNTLVYSNILYVKIVLTN